MPSEVDLRLPEQVDPALVGLVMQVLVAAPDRRRKAVSAAGRHISTDDVHAPDGQPDRRAGAYATAGSADTVGAYSVDDV